MTTPQLLTKREAASRARLHPVTLNRLIRDGAGPAVTSLGKKTLISESALEEWFRKRTVTAVGEVTP